MKRYKRASRTWRTGSAPALSDDDEIGVPRQHRVSGEEAARKHECLRDQESIERVPVVERKLRNRTGCGRINYGFAEAGERRRLGDLERFDGEIHSAELRLDGDLPNARGAEECRIGRRDQFARLGRKSPRVRQRPKKNMRVDEDTHLCFEGFEKIRWQRRVEVVGYAQKPGERAESHARLHVRERDQLRNRFAGLSDSDFLAGGCPIDEAREVSFRLMDVDRRHGLSLVWSRSVVKWRG